MSKAFTNSTKNTTTFEMISFLSKILFSDAQITRESFYSYEPVYKDSSPRTFTLLTLEDGSKWVQGDKGIERIIGAKYLDIQLKSIKGLNFKWSVVPMKYYQNAPIKFSSASELVKGGSPILSFSKYVGSEKPEWTFELEQDKLKITIATGFHDFEYNANLRKQPDGSIIIIDTERGSFKGHNEEFFLPPAEQEYEFSLDQIFSFAALGDVVEHNSAIIGHIKEYLADDFG